MTAANRLRGFWRWRPFLAYGLVSLAVLTILLNLVSDVLVSRYERNAPRDPGSIYLKGMTPRKLGPADSTRAVLFVHGFTGAQSNFNDLPDQVAAMGWHVRTMRLAGHGTSPRDFERTSAEDLIAGVLDEVRTLKSRFPTVVVIGHSLGGALATVAVSVEPVDGLVLCAPFFGLTVDEFPGVSSFRLIRMASTVLRWVPGRPKHGPVNKVENRPFIDMYHWIPVQGALAALEVAERAASPGVCSRICAPLLLIHSLGDSVTSPAATAAVAPAFGSVKKEIIWLKKSDHVLFWDYDEDIVAEAVIRYLKELEAHEHD